MNRIIFLLGCVLIASCSPDKRADAPMQPLERHESRAAEPEPAEAAAGPGSSGTAIAPAGQTAPAPEPAPKGPWPFVGRRVFETRPAVTGTGTPHRVVEIMENGDVYFEYGQQNPAKGTMDGEKYFAGSFGRIMKCEFVKLDDIRYYIIGHTAIVEVDENGKRLKSPDCCENKDFDQETECPCQGDLFGVTPEPQP